MAHVAGQGLFIDRPLATLQTMQTEWLACLSALALNQSYSISGRSVTRSNLAEVSATLAEVSYAISMQTGTRVSRTYASFDIPNPAADPSATDT